MALDLDHPEYKTLKNVIFVARNISGVTLECAILVILGYYGYHFIDEWRSMIGVNLLFLFILLARISWCFLIKCGSPLGWITTAEEILLVADFLLIPGMFTAEIALIYQDDDFCGMKMQTRWRCYFYLGIFIVAILLAVSVSLVVSRLCRELNPSQLPESPKFPLEESTENNRAAENSLGTTETLLGNNSSDTDDENGENKEEGGGEESSVTCKDKLLISDSDVNTVQN
ncbi:uncharacterized protein [Pyxicephalus adspersus]|uniref:uncharacterized protein n=1 Tax=Pyxicephalus adspersus TaxID=30357 RepID=UPI003B5B7BF4